MIDGVNDTNSKYAYEESNNTVPQDQVKKNMPSIFFQDDGDGKVNMEDINGWTNAKIDQFINENSGEKWTPKLIKQLNKLISEFTKSLQKTSENSTSTEFKDDEGSTYTYTSVLSWRKKTDGTIVYYNIDKSGNMKRKVNAASKTVTSGTVNSGTVFYSKSQYDKYLSQVADEFMDTPISKKEFIEKFETQYKIKLTDKEKEALNFMADNFGDDGKISKSLFMGFYALMDIKDGGNFDGNVRGNNEKSALENITEGTIVAFLEDSGYIGGRAAFVWYARKSLEDHKEGYR